MDNAGAIRANVLYTVRKLREDSAYLDSMCWEKGLRIVGADYSLSTGAVDVFHQDA